TSSSDFLTAMPPTEQASKGAESQENEGPRFGNGIHLNVVNQRHIESDPVRIRRRTGICIAMAKENVPAAQSDGAQIHFRERCPINRPGCETVVHINRYAPPLEARFPCIRGARW